MTEPCNFTLNTLKDTAVTAKKLAKAIQKSNLGVLLWYADLGMGKTTFTRALVEALPGGIDAEIASPSFTIANIYYTSPVVHHYDLYRLGMGTIEESLEESFADPNILTIVEWAEHLKPQDMPEDGICCCLALQKTGKDMGRSLAVTALGPIGKQCLDIFKIYMNNSILK